MSPRKRKSNDANVGTDGGKPELDGGHPSVVGEIRSDAGSDSAGPSTVNTAEFDGDGNGSSGNDGQSVKRTRGPYKPRAAKEKQIPINVNGLEKLLVGIHATLALIVQAPEMALDTEAKDFDGKTEAEFLAASIKDVAAHYRVEWMDQKSIDWLNLAQCCIIVYGGRFYAMRESRRAARPVKAAPIVQTTATPRGNGMDRDNVADIPGIGPIEFPADHPMAVKH